MSEQMVEASEAPEEVDAVEAARQAVAAAAATITTLMAKLAAIDDRLAVNKRTRADLSYDAHAGGDVKAQSALADLAREAVRITFSREEITSALVTARARFADTEANMAREEAIANALDAREAFDELAVHIKKYAAATTAIRVEFDAVRAAARALAQTTFGPNARMVEVFCRRYLVAQLQGERALWFGDDEPMASFPERQSLSTTVARWHEKLGDDTRAVLGEHYDDPEPGEPAPPAAEAA